MEKTREHNESLLVLFVDLRKAYDSVPREALWIVLAKRGISPLMLKVIRYFHDGACAKIRVGGLLLCLTSTSVQWLPTGVMVAGKLE